MKNKRLKAISLLFLLLSCDDSFLETRPYGTTEYQTLSQTRDGAEALLIGAYSLLDGYPCINCLVLGSAASNWVYGSILGGDAYKGSEEDDQPEINEIEISQTSPLNPYPEAKWITYYNGIQRANDAIRAFQNLQVLNLSEADRMMRIGEAKFLRAYFHFDLYKIFRHVPFIDEKATDTRVSNEEDILPKIQEDFIYASAHLPWTQPEPGRVTKGAAQSYLGITWMWSQPRQYEAAKIMFDSVIASGRYSLNAAYHENFNVDFRNLPESILEVQQSVEDGALGENGNFGDVLNYPHWSTAPVGCCGFHQPSQDLVNAFRTDDNGLPLLYTYNEIDVTSDEGVASDEDFTPYAGYVDPRLDWTVGRRGIPYLDWGIHPGVDWIRKQSYGGPYSPIKTMFHQSQEEQATDNASWTSGLNSNNLKLLRYADLLLYAAEAEVELGNLEQARAYVNIVRERAMNPAGYVMNDNIPAANYHINIYQDEWTDKKYAQDAARFERRLELGMEGHRFFDLVRWGIAAEEKNKYFAQESKKRYYMVGISFEESKDELQPIPETAIKLSYKDGKPTLAQNPNY